MRDTDMILQEFGEEILFADSTSTAPRPQIQVQGGGLSTETTLAEEALIEAGVGLYLRGQTLVRPVVQEIEASRHRITKIAQLIAVQQPFLNDLLCQHIEWVKYDARIQDVKPINPPPYVASTMLSRIGQLRFPVVAGVISTPTLRPDGSILSIEGYDPATRLLLIAPPEMPDIPDHPTRDDALVAIALLGELIAGFPFVDEASKSVALSCLITPIVRGAFPVSPLHAARASTAGSGKSYLMDIVSAIATGQPCPVMAAGRTEEETEKRLGAALLASQPIISIDNVNGSLGGDALCQIVERPIVEIRILGKSERVRIESRSTVFATGNNLCVIGDMTRRTLLCSLDANMERPELREFNNDPVALVLADRGKYIAAILTIVRAYICAGKPTNAPNLASFGGWSDIVRSAIMWLGHADPCDTMEKAREEDPTLQTMINVFAEIRSAIGASNPKTAAEIISVSLEKATGTEESSPYRHPDLREALMNAAGGKTGFINAKELGKWLGRHKGRIVNGLRLDSKTDQNGHASTWWMTPTSGSSG